MKENNLIIRRVEWIFAIVVLLVCSVVLGKYAVLSATGHDISYNVEKVLVEARNKSVADDGIQANPTRSYTLKNRQGKWELFEGSTLSSDYQVINQDNIVAIRQNITESKKHDMTFVINGVRDYFTRDGLVVTDIPYEQVDRFTVAEQEDLFPIIGYHNVFGKDDEIKDPFIDIRKDDFEEQVQIYNDNLNCRWFGMSEIVENYLTKNRKLPRNACVMTFDDGRKNNYEIVLPILKQNNIKATFFIIAGRLGQKSYMSNLEVSSLYRANNEINSHSITGGSLVDPTWYPGVFTHETLVDQIKRSREFLNSYGYNSKIFAYPLGEYDDNVLSVVKSAGYIGARTTKKSGSWRDPRAFATHIDSDFIWQLNYYQPELKLNDQIVDNLSYNGWWQFEEGSRISGDSDNNVRTLSTVKPTETSYGIVYLEDSGDAIENAFILGDSGSHIIDIIASNSGLDGTGFTTEIDSNILEPVKDTSQPCVFVKNEQYCHYLVQNSLSDGKHLLKITNNDGGTGLDKFQIKRLILWQNSYGVRIEEYL